MSICEEIPMRAIKFTNRTSFALVLLEISDTRPASQSVNFLSDHVFNK